MKNLQLVLLWREREGEPLRRLSVANVCTDRDSYSCDAYYVANVFQFHCGKRDAHHSGLLSSQKFSRIYICGDHGPHFYSANTVYNESTWEEKFQLKVRVIFLCSYHAYNPCDAAGVRVKQAAAAAAKRRVVYNTSADFARALNQSQYGGAIAFAFDKINRYANNTPSPYHDQ